MGTVVDLDFLKRHARWLAAGFLLALASSFGQTYFISLFGGELRAHFDLSHGGFGGLYTLATLSSAATLVWLGKLADHKRLALVGFGTLCGLAAACLAMAGVSSILMLVFVLYGLRLFGQGMLSHLAITAVGRWFVAYRGRALSIAVLGFPAGEAVFPFVAVSLMGGIGWREAWAVAAGVLLLVVAPAVLWSLQREPLPEKEAGDPGSQAVRRAEKRQWTRKEVLRDPLFYALMPGILAPSFIVTGVFFHQVLLVTAKGWDLSWFAASYPIYACATVAVSLVAGWAIDRWGAVPLLPYYLLPLAVGLIVLSATDSPTAMLTFMLLTGATAGGAVTLIGALWPELYGVRYLGAIRALAMAGMVFSSALSPGVMGWLADLGASLEQQFIGLAVCSLGAAGGFALLGPRLRSLAAT